MTGQAPSSLSSNDWMVAACWHSLVEHEVDPLQAAVRKAFGPIPHLLSLRAEGPGSRLELEWTVPDGGTATRSVVRLVERTSAELGPDVWSFAGLRLRPLDEAMQQEDSLTGADLVGAAEVTKLLQVSRPRLGELMRRPDFPRPLTKLRAGYIWHQRDVSDFARRWDRRVGRRSRARTRVVTPLSDDELLVLLDRVQAGSASPVDIVSDVKEILERNPDQAGIVLAEVIEVFASRVDLDPAQAEALVAPLARQEHIDERIVTSLVRFFRNPRALESDGLMARLAPLVTQHGQPIHRGLLRNSLTRLSPAMRRKVKDLFGTEADHLE